MKTCKYSYHYLFYSIIFKISHFSVVNGKYGFLKELENKGYDVSILGDILAQLFAALPLAAVLEEAVFVTYGGLITQPDPANDNQPSGKVSLAEIQAIERFEVDIRSIGFERPQHQLLWNDPISDDILPLYVPSVSSSPPLKLKRVRRGTLFSSVATKEFLAHNQLQLVIRSHQEVLAGYQYHHDEKVITVFSAPNYCGDGENQGALIEFSDAVTMQPCIKQFEAVHYPVKKKSVATAVVKEAEAEVTMMVLTTTANDEN